MSVTGIKEDRRPRKEMQARGDRNETRPGECAGLLPCNEIPCFPLRIS